MSDMKKYCYKVKYSYLKNKKHKNAYAKAKIEELGFSPMFEEFDEGHVEWAGGWAKSISLKHDGTIGTWIKQRIEFIYNSEAKKELTTNEPSKWIKEILESGFEFKDGKLVENEKAKEPVQAQLCVLTKNESSLGGCLFLNVGGGIEIYDTDTLDADVANEINELSFKNIIYKKRLKLEE